MSTEYGALLGLHGTLHLDTIDSVQIASNALGDSPKRPLIVYTPPGYAHEGARRFPVLYCLHGYTGDALALIGARAWEQNVAQRIDGLIRDRRMPPAILAIVDGWTRLGGSQYVDSVHNGNFARYVVEEVIPAVDARYRTIAHAGGRAVFGKSSGGFGAMHLVMEYPGVFGAVASHSGDSYFEFAHPRAFPSVQRTLEKHQFSFANVVETFEKKHKRSQAEFETMEMLGYAAAYSPRSNEPFDIALPFDMRTGEIDAEVFERWIAFDPVRRIPRKGEELASLRLRYLDCGRRDEYGLDIGARLMAQRMRELGLEVRHEEFDDDHRNVGYRYDVSLPALAAVLDGDS